VKKHEGKKKRPREIIIPRIEEKGGKKIKIPKV
jgi:hypothetical protein